MHCHPTVVYALGYNMGVQKIQQAITLCECFGRDGLQSFRDPLPTTDKVAILNRLLAAGFKKIEVTSFVPAAYIPQFADAEAVLRGIDRMDDVRYLAFVPNSRGAESAAICKQSGFGPTDLLIVVSASEAHNQRNLRREWVDTLTDHAQIGKIAVDAGLAIVGSVSTSFGCPYSGQVPIENVFRFVDHYLELGAHEIQFGDTTGMANPYQVYDFFQAIFDRYPGLPAIAHFHDVRGLAISNTLAALECGVTMVDTALGGTGGRPYEQRLQESGPTGNLCTEDFVALCAEMELDIGRIDPHEILAIGGMAEQALGHVLFSHVQRSGLTDSLHKSLGPMR